jgi:hypothetical protein
MISCFECTSLISLLIPLLDRNVTFSGIAGAVERVCETVAPVATCAALRTEVTEGLESIPPWLAREEFNATSFCGLFSLCTTDCCAVGGPVQQITVTPWNVSEAEYVIAYVTPADDTAPPCVTVGAKNTKYCGQRHTYTAGGWLGSLVRINAHLPDAPTAVTFSDGVVRSLTTLPSTYPLRFAVTADMGTEDESDDTLAAIAASGVDGWLNVGDESYSDGIEHIFDLYFRKIDAAFASVPRVPTLFGVGNHEIVHSFAGYRARVVRPGVATPNAETKYFSVRLHRVQFIQLAGESVADTAELEGEQLEWAKRTLADAAAARAQGEIDWIVVGNHRPFYCSDNWSDCVFYAQYLRDAIEPAMTAAGVDLVLSGHRHNYQRFFPVTDNGRTWTKNLTAPSKPPVHILQGAAGNREGLAPDTHNTPPYEATYNDTRRSYSLLSFLSPTHLQWTTYSAQDNTILDKFELKR